MKVVQKIVTKRCFRVGFFIEENKKDVDMRKLLIVREFWDFMKLRKKWWLFPIVAFLLILGALIILTEGSAIAPFIYTLF